MKKEVKAILFLFLATAFWGGTFPVIKNAVAFVAPTVFVTLRFALAALILLPFVIKEFKHNSFATVKAGIILGTLNDYVGKHLHAHVCGASAQLVEATKQ